MKRKILQLVTGLGVGGAERVVLDLSIGLDPAKYENAVLALSKKNEMLDTFREHGIEVTSLNKSNRLSDFLSMVTTTRDYIRTHRIELIHAHMTHAMILAVVLKLFSPKLKIVFTSHNTTFGSKLRNVIICLLKPFRDVDILFSEGQRTPIYKKRYEVIPNGIDTKPYRERLEKFETFTFLSVGRLDAAKNHLHLIDCAKVLEEQNIEFQVLIAGEGVLRPEIEAKIAALGLQQRVTLLGIRRDIAGLMSRSHAFVMPSLWEGLPIVLLEAGASGLPCISTPVGTIPSLLDDTNAYLAQTEDFAAKMVHVYHHPDEAQEQAQKLREKVERHYSIGSIVQRHEAIYDACLGTGVSS